MKNLKLTLLFIGILTFNSCYFDSGRDKIIGDYALVWIDLLEQQSICRFQLDKSTICEVLVSEYVFALGHDSNFIIAKQHPTSGFKSGFKIDTTSTNYYIIDMNRTFIKQGHPVIGPLSQNQFNLKVSELGIREIKFDQIYPHNPGF